MSKDEFQHASYGMITLEKTYGNGERLFGSDVEHDPHYILRVFNAIEVHHKCDLTEIRKVGRSFLQLRLTPSQVVGLIHNIDRRPGTPCTIAFMEGHEVDMPPKRHVDTPIDGLVSVSRKRADGLRKLLETNLEAMDVILSKRGIKNSDKVKLREMVAKGIRAVTSEVPFTLDRIVKAKDMIVAQAKSEIEAYRTFNPGNPQETRAEATLREVKEILWPARDPGESWEVDTIEHVAAAISDYFQPEELND